MPSAVAGRCNLSLCENHSVASLGFAHLVLFYHGFAPCAAPYAASRLTLALRKLRLLPYDRGNAVKSNAVESPMLAGMG
jgi:hypothetical protein